MKKFGKKGIFAAALLTATLSVSALTPTTVHAASTVTVPTGFEKEEIEVKGKNEALNGWMYYYMNDKDADGKDRGMVYDSENLHVLATKAGRTGNALHLKRDKADGELVMYSYAFDVKPDQNYVIGAYLKSICEQTAGNKVYFKIKEQSANGATIGDEHAVLHTVTGKVENWTETTFSYKTSTSATTLILKIFADGVGDFYVDDITVKESNAGVNSVLYRMQSIGKTADGATDELGDAEKANKGMYVLTSANIYGDSSDGDNASLLVNDGEIFKTNFSMLDSSKTYRLSFKYKMLEAGSQSRMSIRMNYFEIGGEDAKYYINFSGGSADQWTPYSLDFTPNGESTFGLAINSYAKYAFDELKIVCLDEDDNMQFIVNGSFSGAYLEGYQYGDNFNIAKQEDGSTVLVAGNGSYDDTMGHRGYFKIPITGLTAGQEYTVSYDHRFNGASWAEYEIRLNNTTKVKGYKGPAATWTNDSFTFTATGNDEIGFYGTSYYYWTTYWKNITVKDSAGNVYNTNRDLVAPKVVLGENVFPYGTFDGNTEYVAEDWTFTGNGNVYGLNFDTRWEPDAKPDWKICLYGSEETPATATSKEITVNKRTLAVNMKTYTGRVKVSVLAGETEIEADENDFFELPEGTTTVKLKFTATEYVAFKYVTLGTHTHAEAADDKITTKAATCTHIGGRYYHCDDCDKNVYLEKTPMLAHEFEHIHEDASCKNGVDKDVCKNCHGEFNVTVIPATGEHVYEEVIINEATCTAPGMKQDKCKICGAAGNTTVIPKKDHDYKNGKCTVCQAEDPDYVAPSNTKKSGCSSNVYGELGLFGILGAAALVIAKRKKG